jgi:predicted DNA binding CopG/RHH family protein
MVERLRREAKAWDRAKGRESEAALTAALEGAEVFRVSRPAREPVSVRLDPQDVFLVKRLARRRGIPYSQLLAQWVHEHVVRETERRAG